MPSSMLPSGLQRASKKTCLPNSRVGSDSGTTEEEGTDLHIELSVNYTSLKILTESMAIILEVL